MNLPPFVYAKAFWEALSWFLGGALALLAYFGLVSAEWALAPAALLSLFLSVLKWFDIEPELKLKEAKSKTVKKLK